MTGKTHIIGGILACQAVDTFVFGNDGGFVYYAAGVAGALVPDICHTHSKIGRRFPVISKLVATIFGHRTFTHSLLFLVIINATLLFFFPDNEALRRGVLIGMASHYVLDALTVRGIRFLYPADIRVRFARIRTGGGFESIMLALFVVAIGWIYVVHV